MPPGSHDEVLEELGKELENYKDYLMKINSKKEINSSDKKKMLSLPFKLHKRKELPEPKFG